MNWSDKIYLVALGNLILCTGIGWSCVCRLGQLGVRSRSRFVAMYAVMLMAATACGFQPLLFGEWPGLSDLIINGAMLYMLMSGRRAWQFGPPQYTLRADAIDTEQVQHVAGGRQ
jgi:hypothetical protein